MYDSSKLPLEWLLIKYDHNSIIACMYIVPLREKIIAFNVIILGYMSRIHNSTIC